MTEQQKHQVEELLENSLKDSQVAYKQAFQLIKSGEWTEEMFLLFCQGVEDTWY